MVLRSSAQGPWQMTTTNPSACRCLLLLAMPYKLGRARILYSANIETRHSILRVGTWIFETLFGTIFRRQPKNIFSSSFFFADFPAILDSQESFWWPCVGKKNVKSKKSLFGCLHEIVPNHESKFQVLTPKIERRTAKFPPKCLCIQVYIYFRDPSITFERKWPMKWNAYLPTLRPKMYMPRKSESIPSTFIF